MRRVRARIDLGLTRADDVLVAGNREALRILVRNLLDNAIKHTPPGGSIDIAVARSRRWCAAQRGRQRPRHRARRARAGARPLLPRAGRPRPRAAA